MNEQNTEIQNDSSQTETDIINNKNNQNHILTQQSLKKSFYSNNIHKSIGLTQRKLYAPKNNLIFMQMSRNYYSRGKLSGIYKKPF